MIREAFIERTVCDYAKNQGCLTNKFNSANRRGVPDDLITNYNGIFLVEFKRKGHLPTPLQRHVFSQFGEKNQHICLIDDVETGKAFIDEINIVDPFWQEYRKNYFANLKKKFNIYTL